MLTEISASQWRTLIERALDFAQAEPWTWMDDAQVVGVVHPTTQEKAYCSIMGRESDFKAIAIYPGRQGWWSYLQLSSENASTDANEIMYKQRCIVLSFEPSASADADDLALLRHAGLQRLAGGSLIPSFRTYLPGYVPATPDLEEFQWLLWALPQALAAAQEVFAGHHVIPDNGLNKAGEMLFRTQSPDGEWASSWLKPDPSADFSPPQIQLAPELAQAARTMTQSQDIWLVEEFFVPEPAEDAEGDRAFFPRAVVFLDMESQEFRGLSLLHPANWPQGAGESMVDMILNQGQRPAQIVVSKKENFILVKPFCQAAGIAINLDPSLDILPDLREAVLEMWREQAE
jgi:hypothetical protein